MEAGARKRMRRRWILVLLLLGAAVCVSATPRVDSPETTFNEADAPVNLAPPVRVRIQMDSPGVDLIVVLPTPFHSLSSMLGDLSVETPEPPSEHHRPFLQSLLCTLLI